MAPFDPVSAAIGGALIGLAATLLMLLTGRIAGIAGILGDLVGSAERAWRLAFVAGLIAAPLALARCRLRVARAADAGAGDRRGRGPAGRVRHAARQWLHLGPRHLRHRAALAALDRRHR